MFSSVSNWFGIGDKKAEEAAKSDDNKENREEGENQNIESPASSDSSSKSPVSSESPSPTQSQSTEEVSSDQESEFAPGQVLEDVSSKAINTAKEWGSLLYSFGKAAGKTVADTATKIKHSVEEKTLLGEFSKEQEKFVTEKKEKAKHREAGVAPWVGYNEEESMKSQILALSQDKRNFVRNPPAGVQFQFDFDSMYPIAMATLQEDPNLQKMRFELVPKMVNEETFWRNYFYRVSLIKQSTQLTSLAQQTGSSTESRSTGSSRRSSTSSEQKGVIDSIESSDSECHVPESSQTTSQHAEEELTAESPPHDNEFISDAFGDNAISDEDLKREMEQLRVDDKPAASKPEGAAGEEDVPEWEKELQQELNDFEMVGGSGDLNDADIEREILEQIESETKGTQ